MGRNGVQNLQSRPHLHPRRPQKHQHLRVATLTLLARHSGGESEGRGCEAGQAAPGPQVSPRTTFRSARPGGGGAGEQEATSPRRGSRPRAASPSARASSGCSPPQTPARLWLTAPCGAAGDGPGAGPGRGWSCGAAAVARDARAGGDPVRLCPARTRTRAHPLALLHAADVPFLNLRNVFLSAGERVRARGRASESARRVSSAPRCRDPAPRRRDPAPLPNPAY